MIRYTVDLSYPIHYYLYDEGAERDLIHMSCARDALYTRLPDDHILAIL